MIVRESALVCVCFEFEHFAINWVFQLNFSIKFHFVVLLLLLMEVFVCCSADKRHSFGRTVIQNCFFPQFCPFELWLSNFDERESQRKRMNWIDAPSHNYPCAKNNRFSESSQKYTCTDGWKERDFLVVVSKQNENKAAANKKIEDEKPNHILTRTYKTKRITTAAAKTTQKTTNRPTTHFTPLGLVSFHLISFHIILCTQTRTHTHTRTHTVLFQTTTTTTKKMMNERSVRPNEMHDNDKSSVKETEEWEKNHQRRRRRRKDI